MASTLVARAKPTAWLKPPLAPIDTTSSGAIDLPVMPTCRLRGSQPWSVTFRVAPSRPGADQLPQLFESVVLAGVHARADDDEPAGSRQLPPGGIDAGAGAE